MTTTDIDTLKTLIADADLPTPIQMDYRHDPELECVIGVMSAGGGVEARIHTEETARLIEAALNALPALLDELTEARREVHLLKNTDDARLFVAQGERDAAREELAKVRRELDEAKEACAAQETDLNESIAATKSALAQLAESNEAAENIAIERDEWRKIAGEARQQAEQWEKRYADMRDQRDTAIQQNAAAHKRIHDASMVRVWVNEDRKRFVFADEVFAALHPDLANPATTAEPATPNATCPRCGTVAGAGCPWTCATATDAEPAAG